MLKPPGLWALFPPGDTDPQRRHLPLAGSGQLRDPGQLGFCLVSQLAPQSGSQLRAQTNTGSPRAGLWDSSRQGMRPRGRAQPPHDLSRACGPRAWGLHGQCCGVEGGGRPGRGASPSQGAGIGPHSAQLVSESWLPKHSTGEPDTEGTDWQRPRSSSPQKQVPDLVPAASRVPSQEFAPGL